MTTLRKAIVPIVLVALVALAYLVWKATRPPGLPDGFAASNGRIEAIEIDIAAKVAGRIASITVDEGDFVTAGQVLAKMDTAVLEAQLKEAQAKQSEAETRIQTARSLVSQRISEKASSEAIVSQRQAELDRDQKQLDRATWLVQRNSMSSQELDVARANFFGSKAAVEAAKANVAAGDSAIATAKSMEIGAVASVEAAKAEIERIQADITDSTLVSPRDGRVQYRVAQPGEVLSNGGRVLNMVDLSDVYITFFLPTADAGRVKIGSDVHIVLDAAPQYVIPARATYVADVAQFTPKTVETAEERQKLTFRIKAHIDPSLLKKYIRNVKTGLPGMAYVRLDDAAAWPASLEVRLPQ
jgi:HlyD family secretion protein